MTSDKKKMTELFMTSMMCSVVPGAQQFAPFLMFSTLADDDDDDKDLVKAIGAEVGQKIQAELAPIKTEITAVKDDISSLKAEVDRLKRQSDSQFKRLNSLDPDNAPKKKGESE